MPRSSKSKDELKRRIVETLESGCEYSAYDLSVKLNAVESAVQVCVSNLIQNKTLIVFRIETLAGTRSIRRYYKLAPKEIPCNPSGTNPFEWRTFKQWAPE